MLFGFYFTSQFTTSYLVQALDDEHRNSTIAIVRASVSDAQLLGGKIVGLGALGLTQIGVWGLGAALTVWGGLQLAQNAGFELAVTIPWGLIGLAALVFVPAYVINATSAATIGGITGMTGEGQLLTSVFSLAQPLAWAAATITLSAPDSPVSVVASLVPLTAPLALLSRAAQVSVPFWQTALSIGLLWGTAIGGISISARLYRAVSLTVGQRRRWWAAIRAFVKS